MHRTKKILEWALIILIAISALVLSLLLSYQQVYGGKIYRNVYFGTINLSGLSKTEAAALIDNKFKDLENKQFTVTCSDKTIKAIIKDTGLSFSSNDLIEKIYNTGRGNNFWSNLHDASYTLLKKTVLIGTPEVDEKALTNFVDIAVKQLNVEPIDAKLSIQDGVINEVKSQNGQIADTNDLTDKIINMVAKGSTNITLASIERPASVSNSDFSQARQTALAYLNKNIVLTYQSQKFTPTKQEIETWIVFANNGGLYSASLDESNIKAYLNKIAKNFEVVKVDVKIDSGSEAILQQGREGIYLDKDNVIASLKSQLGASSIMLDLVVKNVPPTVIRVTMSQGVEMNRFPEKYIDVNLSTQTLCRVLGPTLIDCFMASTGKPSTPTPTGSFAITRKNPWGWAPNPGVHMPWFQEFKVGGWGFHELVVWPDGTHEVIEHLGQPVSHGCIRTGPGVAEMLYNWTDIGTPVYIHK